MRDITITSSEKLTTEACASCGVLFAMPAAFVDKRRETGHTFYCPNGHSLVFASQVKKLEAELDAERTRVERLRQEVDR
jgi:hypothetical protein